LSRSRSHPPLHSFPTRRSSDLFRQSLAAILRQSLALSPRAGRDRARLVDERPLSQWIEENCALTTAVVAKPWTIEDEVIRHGLRSEEHTSELQSRGHLVCRLLL